MYFYCFTSTENADNACSSWGVWGGINPSNSMIAFMYSSEFKLLKSMWDMARLTLSCRAGKKTVNARDLLFATKEDKEDSTHALQKMSNPAIHSVWPSEVVACSISHHSSSSSQVSVAQYFATFYQDQTFVLVWVSQFLDFKVLSNAQGHLETTSETLVAGLEYNSIVANDSLYIQRPVSRVYTFNAQSIVFIYI